MRGLEYLDEDWEEETEKFQKIPHRQKEYTTQDDPKKQKSPKKIDRQQLRKHKYDNR